ncbi:MAG TPA: ABC transporter permease, partial [Fimbriimonadaceae bacterium]|nr:ABC transporter permease [Fimbriimonadaceae bacterium]
ELWRFRELLFSMVQRDLKIRYKNSFLGFLWSLLNPLITVATMTVVFQLILDNHTPNLGAYIFAAYLPYMFFQLCLLDSSQSILLNIQLIKKIYFPREILPLAGAISNFIHFLLGILVLFAFLIVVYIFFPGAGGVRVWPFHSGIVILPLLLFMSFSLATGFSLLISAANTFYEDVKYIVAVLLYLMFFLCPIMYFSEKVYYSLFNSTHPWFYRLYNLNPIAALCTAYRKALLDPQPVQVGNLSDASGHLVLDAKGQPIPLMKDAIGMDWKYVAIAFLFSVAILLIGYHVFNRLKWRFVERP